MAATRPARPARKRPTVAKHRSAAAKGKLQPSSRPRQSPKLKPKPKRKPQAPLSWPPPSTDRANHFVDIIDIIRTLFDLGYNSQEIRDRITRLIGVIAHDRKHGDRSRQ